MKAPAILQEVNLINGLTIAISDSTTHYFGGFHNVRLAISCEIPVTTHLLKADLVEEARKLLGDKATFERTLERMGVHPDELNKVKSELIASFLDNALTYMNTPDFPRRFLLSKLKEKCTRKEAGYSVFYGS